MLKFKLYKEPFNNYNYKNHRYYNLDIIATNRSLYLYKLFYIYSLGDWNNLKLTWIYKKGIKPSAYKTINYTKH